jgi:hypothetical protein
MITVDQVVVSAGGQITVNSGVTVTLSNGALDELKCIWNRAG